VPHCLAKYKPEYCFDREMKRLQSESSASPSTKQMQMIGHGVDPYRPVSEMQSGEAGSLVLNPAKAGSHVPT
jgi:hypothetical protein